MEIKETCKDWHLLYNNPSLPELDPDTSEFKILSSVLHLSGDVVAAYNNVPKDITQEFKDLLLDSLAVILTDTKNQIVDCINSSVSAHALTLPLGKGYSEEEIFGMNITERFKSLLDPETELPIAAEHFHALQDTAWVDEDDDDDRI